MDQLRLAVNGLTSELVISARYVCLTCVHMDKLRRACVSIEK